MRIIIILLALIGFNFCNAQIDFKKGIIGTWKLVEKVSDLDDDKEGDLIINKSIEKKKDPIMNKNVTCTFKSNGVVTFLIHDFSVEAKYTFENSDLILGNRKYTIVKVQKDSLFFKDKNGLLNTRYTYKRIK